MRDLHREEEGRKGAQRGGVWGAANHFRIDFQLDVNMPRVRGGEKEGESAFISEVVDKFVCGSEYATVVRLELREAGAGAGSRGWFSVEKGVGGMPHLGS